LSAAEPSPLMLSGFTELALGALTGWVYSLAITDPERARRLGVRAPDRARQWHLDLIALGGLSVLVSTALPDLPRRVALPLGVGCWTNAMSFGVLMVRPELADTRPYKAAIGTSFVVTSAGFVGAAREAWRRRRRSEGIVPASAEAAP
jgi:hypothetical protein